MCVCVWYACAYGHAQRSQKRMPSIFLYHSWLYSWRLDLLLVPKITTSSRLAQQQAPRIFLCLIPLTMNLLACGGLCLAFAFVLEIWTQALLLTQQHSCSLHPLASPHINLYLSWEEDVSRFMQFVFAHRQHLSNKPLNTLMSVTMMRYSFTTNRSKTYGRRQRRPSVLWKGHPMTAGSWLWPSRPWGTS